MGALSGTLSYKLFYVQGEVPENWQELYLQQIRKNAFKPLKPEDEEEVSEGWVPVERPLQISFDLHTLLFDHFINLGFRQDKYAIPSALLKAHVEEAEREYMIQNDKQRLSKFEREDIKIMVKRKLKEKQLPRMKVIDMSWDLQKGRVRFWSQSGNVCELFQGYFEDTFGLKLLPGNPYINAVQLEPGPEKIEELAVVEPTNFIEGLPQR
ncbi:hypothetical protein EA187_14225 [Lujinxingia sediminis]|uniref:Recombination-associated protein RdgC n=1 Tax=Lujinxingia sediminis TaxID=2480984 RepID=A0ABY0CRV5_9DELT|nr:hypothetical protein [Lujinxingia sediminis]RVU42988.1 hypothetical protein EA187_14225 [Lujinxingia sediminis]